MHPKIFLYSKIFLYYSISHNVYSAKILGVWWHSEAIHMLQGSVFRSRLVGFVQTWYNWRPGLKCPHKPGGGTGCPKNVHWKLIDRGDAIERFDTLLTKLPSSEQTQAAARWVMVGDIWGSSGSFKRLWAVRSVSWGTWSVGRFAKRPSKAWNEVWSSFIIVSCVHILSFWTSVGGQTAPTLLKVFYIISRWQGTAADVNPQYAKGLRARMSVTRQHVLDDHRWKIFKLVSQRVW